jgi:hypothetical protein
MCLHVWFGLGWFVSVCVSLSGCVLVVLRSVGVQL